MHLSYTFYIEYYSKFDGDIKWDAYDSYIAELPNESREFTVIHAGCIVLLFYYNQQSIHMVNLLYDRGNNEEMVIKLSKQYPWKYDRTPAKVIKINDDIHFIDINHNHFTVNINNIIPKWYDDRVNTYFNKLVLYWINKEYERKYNNLYIPVYLKNLIWQFYSVYD